MYENLGTRIRTARKQHKCDWCNKVIDKGEKYENQKFVCDGKIYEWKAHEACQRVVDAIWEYADPDDGMNSDGFYEYGQEVCRKFICPDCPNWNDEFKDCELDNNMCIDRMDEFFMTHELYGTREGYYIVFRCREKERHNGDDSRN